MPQYCHRANSCLLLFTIHVAATSSCVTNVQMLQDTPRLAALSEKVIWDEIMQQEATSVSMSASSPYMDVVDLSHLDHACDAV